MQPSQKKVRVFKSRAGTVATSHMAGQGFQSLSFAKEQAHVNKGWSKTSDAKQICILSPKAISEIASDVEKGVFKDREGATEPPFMAPSTDPSQYSKV